MSFWSIENTNLTFAKILTFHNFLTLASSEKVQKSPAEVECYSTTRILNRFSRLVQSRIFNVIPRIFLTNSGGLTIEFAHCLVEESGTKPESRTLCDWISLNLYLNISVLFRLLVTFYKKIRRSQEILGNQDSANPWVLNEPIKIRNLIAAPFLHVAYPSYLVQHPWAYQALFGERWYRRHLRHRRHGILIRHVSQWLAL